MDAFAAEIQRLATHGGFDPMALLGDAPGFHSVFLAPFTPALAAAIKTYLETGEGPLQGVEEQLRAQGAPDPKANARSLFTSAQGMCVVVLAGHHGVATVPQLFHGDLGPGWCEHACGALGDDRAGREQLLAALADLGRQAGAGGRWPALVAGPGVGGERGEYWLDLAAATASSLDSILPAARERLADLAHWCAGAIDALGIEGEAEDRAGLVRLRLVAGDIAGAGRQLDRLLAGGHSDGLAELLQVFVDGAIRAGREGDAASWLHLNLERFDQVLGEPYDTAAALFRLRAAAGGPAAALLATATLLAARDRKAMRQDLTRERIWQVRPELAGELVDTAEAAQLIGRSPAFVAKRLDQGTIPATRDGERLRLPKGALLAWKAVMDAHALLA